MNMKRLTRLAGHTSRVKAHAKLSRQQQNTAETIQAERLAWRALEARLNGQETI